MKLRIKGNSIRIRLSITEVNELVSGATLTDSTSFGKSRFGYTVQPVDSGELLSASYERDVITLNVPKYLLKDWSTNSTVGFEATMPVDDRSHLHLLLEKDFKCIDQTVADQSDFYDNPAKSC
jgi:hypothetical protein